MLSPLHFWVVFVATGGLLVLLAWLGSRRRRLNPRQVAESTGDIGCAHCGYDVRGLPSDICPECGSDLNEVGRIAPQFRRWQAVPPLLRGLVFAPIVLLLAAMFGGMALADFVPYRRRVVSSQDLRLRTLAPPGGSLVLLPTTWTTEHRHASESQIRTSDVKLQPGAIEDRIVIEAVPGNAATGLPSGPPIARLEVDGIAGAWAITQGLQTLRRGTGALAPEDALFFLSLAVYPDKARPELEEIVARATAGLDADRVQRDEARRLLSAAGALYTDAGLLMVGTELHDYRTALLRVRPGSQPWTLLPKRWRESIPERDFRFSFQGGGTGELVYFTASGEIDWWPSLAYTIPMAAFWLLVLAASVYFATRRRAIRPRPLTAPFESTTLPAASPHPSSPRERVAAQADAATGAGG